MLTVDTRCGTNRAMRTLCKSGLVALGAVALLALATAIPAQASNLVVNGDFEMTSLSSPGGFFCQLGSTCVSNVAGWMSQCRGTTCGTGFTVLSLLFPGTNGSAFNGNVGLDGTIADSPTGGNFVAGDGDPSFNAPFWQNVPGLIPGQRYALDFDQAAGQQKGDFFPSTEQWEIQIGSSTYLSTLMNNPSGGFTPWNHQTIHFVASATTELLWFEAQGAPSGVPPVVMIDGVSITAVPEPTSLGLVATGLLGLAGFAARFKKRS